MLDRMLALSGPVAWLTWVSAANVVVGLATLLILAVCKAPPRAGTSLAFTLAFVLVYGRSFVRNMYGLPVSYWGVALHALVGLTCAWKAADAIRWRRRAGWTAKPEPPASDWVARTKVGGGRP